MATKPAALRTYDPANPPAAKLHVTAQVDRDLTAFSTGRTRMAWKQFPVRDEKTKAEVCRIEFTNDGGLSFVFDGATAKERAWSISINALFDCVTEADKQYVAARVAAATPVGKAKTMRAAAKIPRPRVVKKQRTKARKGR